MTGIEQGGLIEMLSQLSDLGKRLKEIDPDHELLKFIDPACSRVPWTSELREEFVKQFCPKTESNPVVTFYIALRSATGHKLN